MNVGRFFTHYALGLWFRLGLVAVYLTDGRALSLWPVLIVMLLELYFGVKNMTSAVAFSSPLVGVLSQAAYFVGWISLPSPAPSDIVFVLFSCSLLLDTWALVHLRECFTFGGPTFVRLVKSGPYAFFPHPQWFARCLIYCAFIPQVVAGDTLALRGLLGCILCSAIVWSCELHFLNQVPEYAESESVLAD